TLSNIIVLDGKSVKQYGVDNYRLMKDTDALITDYSSVACDYLHLDRPIGYTLDDEADYRLGFLVNPPEKLMAGEKIYNYDQLIDFISGIVANKDLYKTARHELFDKCFKYHDGKSCERLAEFLHLD
ncbi:MAG: CDP-glycerol glycerophosphotransferase family protein, partial [Lachnospiraceae bacterium]|nr:CDP-glycerol glycerophosphotransferase family protein [Lachnospiraceae bacterium]